MAVAKAIPANDIIEGVPVVLPRTGAAAADMPDWAPHFTGDPSQTTLGLSINARWGAGTWTEGRNVDTQSASDVSAPAVGAEASLSYSGVPNQQHTIFGVSWSYNAPTNGSGMLTIEAGSGNIVFSKQIPGSAATEDEVLFSKGLRTTRSSAMIVRLTGVAGAKGQVAALGHRVE